MTDNKKALIEILNKGMMIEYASIWHYPRLARLIRDPEAAKLFSKLGRDSVHHASEMAKMLRALGANPEDELLESLREPERDDILPILRNMLEQEKTAAKLYKQAGDLADDYSTRTWLTQQVKEELGHAAAVEIVIAKINRDKA